MPLLLPLTDTAIADYRQHVGQHPNTDPVILAYLTRHVNGLMCAEIEQVATRLIQERLEIGCRDEATSHYLKSLRRNAVRNATFSEIKNKLALFGTAYLLRFDELVRESVGEAGIEKLGMAVGKRNQDSHENPADVTFRELEEAYSIANAVVNAASTVSI